MSNQVNVYETLSENAISFGNKEEFIAYYKTHSNEIDQMPTRGLNIKFRINGYKIGRKGVRITLIPTKSYSTPIEEPKSKNKKPIVESKRVPPKRKHEKRKYYSESSSSSEDYYSSDDESSSSEEYYRPPKRKEIKKHSRKQSINPRQAIKQAAYRATQPGRTDLTPDMKLNALNGRVKQLEMALNDVYSRYEVPQQQQIQKEVKEVQKQEESNESSYESSSDEYTSSEE